MSWGKKSYPEHWSVNSSEKVWKCHRKSVHPPLCSFSWVFTCTDRLTTTLKSSNLSAPGSVLLSLRQIQCYGVNDPEVLLRASHSVQQSAVTCQPCFDKVTVNEALPTNAVPERLCHTNLTSEVSSKGSGQEYCQKIYIELIFFCFLMGVLIWKYFVH